MILYLHGFASSGSATKAGVLRGYVEKAVDDKNVITPDLPVEPDGAWKVITSIIEGSKEKKIVFGSSLGGFYALYASCKYGVPCVLINPAIIAHVALEDAVGMHKNFKTGEDFEFKNEYLYQLEKMYNEIDFSGIEPKNTVLLLAKDDRLLNYKKTLMIINEKAGQVILEDNAGHEFSKFGEVLPRVFEYLNNR
ncbi:MAG: esterase [Bacteroidetes bacterium]|nr:esterase [Bacteroidota bacterium]